MPKLIALLAILACLTINTLSIAAYVDINDGLQHVINDDFYQASHIRLDYNIANSPGTRIDLIDGGLIKSLTTCNNASVTMTGGVIVPVSFHGGGGPQPGMIVATAHSTVIIAGGTVENVNARDNATISVSGGLIGLGLYANNNGIIYLEGSDFEYLAPGNTATSLSYGDKLSDFGRLREDHFGNISHRGKINGTLTDGSVIHVAFSIQNTGDIVILSEPIYLVTVDIKPQSCPNPLNVKSKGVFDVAILGTDDFDVRDIDLSTVSLEGVAPLRSRYKDETTPVIDGQECECRSKKNDGIMDLTMKFDTEQIIAALGEVEDGQEWLLHLTGSLYDGTEIEGTDCILIKKKGKQ